MKFQDILCKKAININLQSKNKIKAITELAQMLVNEKKVKKLSKTVKALMDREKQGSTGLGQGIAIPHARTDNVNSIVCALGISKEGIDFDSLDGNPVHLVFLILSPPDDKKQYLNVVADLFRLLKNTHLKHALIDAEAVKEVIRMVEKEDVL